MLHLLYYCPITHAFGRSVHCRAWPIQRCEWRHLGQMQQMQPSISFEMFKPNHPSPLRAFPLFFSFMQCKVEQVGTNISCMFWFLLCMFWFLLCMFWFLNILFHLFRMGNKKPRKKKPKGGRPAGSRSHQNICLNRWDEEAMMYAIQEYNSLCVQHSANNVSIKAVAESYHIPTTTFWKRLYS